MTFFKLGIWLILLSIRWPVSYKNDGEWYNSNEAMDLFSFIDEMTLAPEVVLSLRYHRPDKLVRTDVVDIHRRRANSAALKVLHAPNSSKKAKTARGSALSQRS